MLAVVQGLMYTFAALYNRTSNGATLHDLVVTNVMGEDGIVRLALLKTQNVKKTLSYHIILYISFRESDLNNKGYLQLAQEISYQWLGAFTTPAWWSDAHLNKALVGYIAAETAFQVNIEVSRCKGIVKLATVFCNISNST